MGSILIVDTTFCSIMRPPSIIQQNYYSGYEKTHGIKYIVFCTPAGLIAQVEGPYESTVDDLTCLLQSVPFNYRLDHISYFLATKNFQQIKRIIYLRQSEEEIFQKTS